MRGLERAFARGAIEVAAVASATETFTEKNQNRSVTESLRIVNSVVSTALGQGLRATRAKEVIGAICRHLASPRESRDWLGLKCENESPALRPRQWGKRRNRDMGGFVTIRETPRGPLVEQRGLWFEEFDLNTTYHHRPGRTVTEADNVLFTTLTMNTQPLHLDAAWSESQSFGGRLVNSLFTLATMVGLSVSQLTLGTLVANLGFTEVIFPHPVHIGDTLYAETLVTGLRLSSSRPGEGVVRLAHAARNQNGIVVARCERATLILCRPAGSP